MEEFEISDDSDDDIFNHMSDDGENFSSEEDDEDVGLESTLRSIRRFVLFFSLSFLEQIRLHSSHKRQTRNEESS